MIAAGLALLLAGAAPVAPALSAQPSIVRLGTDASARLSVLAGERPALSVSAGRIEGLREEGPGRWAADYVPPEELFPRVAVVAAAAEGEVAFLSIPLWGQGDALVRTRPRGRITVRIGEEVFGPVIADAKGVALVPVVVPPGVRAAFHGKDPIDLHVPPSQGLHLALAAQAAPADRPATVPVRIFAIDPQGKARAGAPLALRVSRGMVSLPVEIAPGLFAADWSVPRGPAGDEQVEAFLRDAKDFIARASLSRPAGAASELVLAPDRPRVVAGEDGEVVLQVELRDAAGNPAEDSVAVTPSLGTAQMRPLGAGKAEVRILVPAAFEGRRRLELAARSSGGAQAAPLSLPLVPGEPAETRIAPLPGPVRADGAGAWVLHVAVLDRFGNPVEDASPSVAVDGGGLASVSAAGDGGYVATYVPPLLRERGAALVRVRAGSAEGQAQIALSPSYRRLAWTPKLGGLTNLARLTSPTIALEGAGRFEVFGEPFAALLEAGYIFAAARNDRLASGAGSIGGSTRDDLALLSASLSFRPQLGDRVQAFFSAGPSLALLRSAQQLDGQPLLVQRAALPGFFLSAGIEQRVGALIPMAELRFTWHRDPRLLTVRGPIAGVSLLLGSRFELL